MQRQLELVTAISFIALAPVGAQNVTAPVSSAGKARILGVVVDSLNGGVLAGADILMDGAQVSAQTDSLGKFEFDGLTPGDFQLGVFHPRLDTLGVSIVTQKFHVGRDSTSVVVMAVPSAATLIRTRCPAQSDAAGASAVIGRVKDPESLQSVAGAEVSIAWSEIEISKQVGIHQTARLRRDTTDKNGEFKFCGLPSSLQASLKARHGSTATAEIPVGLGDRPIELAARTLLLSAADSTTKTGNAAVSGVVQLADGAPSSGTRVELVGTDIVTLTDAKAAESCWRDTLVTQPRLRRSIFRRTNRRT